MQPYHRLNDANFEMRNRYSIVYVVSIDIRTICFMTQYDIKVKKHFSRLDLIMTNYIMDSKFIRKWIILL